MPKVFNSLQEKRTYQCWADMKNRCNNKNHKRYADYGGRGIKVCDEWNSYENFVRDMGLKPDGLVLDRVDNSGNYVPVNCRWATYHDSNKNTRRNTYYTYEGKTQTIEEWAEKYDMPRSTLSSRIHSYRWPIGIALETPVGCVENMPIDPDKAKFVPSLNKEIADKIRKLYCDEGHSQVELSRWFDVSPTTIWRIVNNLSYSEKTDD
jgi:hypothetical protein